MALISDKLSPNKAPAEYFTILRGEILCGPGQVDPRIDIWLGQYVNEEARRTPEVNPLYQHRVAIPFSSMNIDIRTILYQMVKDSGFFGEDMVYDAIDNNDNLELNSIKQLKKNEIQRAKNRANKGNFVFRGVEFQGNDDAMLQIQITTQGIVARGGRLRDDWNGAWLAADNSPYPILDVETWYAMLDAIETTGQANFDRAVALKARIDAATTVDEVDSIHWNMDLSQPYVPPEAPGTVMEPPPPKPELEPEEMTIQQPPAEQ